MHLITKQALIATVAQRWRDVHQRRGQWLAVAEDANPQQVYERLLALPDDASEAQIASLVGDNRWTQNICHECGEDAGITVAVGAEIHHPTDTSILCLACLQQAVSLAGSANQ